MTEFSFAQPASSPLSVFRGRTVHIRTHLAGEFYLTGFVSMYYGIGTMVEISMSAQDPARNLATMLIFLPSTLRNDTEFFQDRI